MDSYPSSLALQRLRQGIWTLESGTAALICGLVYNTNGISLYTDIWLQLPGLWWVEDDDNEERYIAVFSSPEHAQQADEAVRKKQDWGFLAVKEVHLEAYPPPSSWPDNLRLRSSRPGRRYWRHPSYNPHNPVYDVVPLLLAEPEKGDLWRQLVQNLNAPEGGFWVDDGLEDASEDHAAGSFAVMDVDTAGNHLSNEAGPRRKRTSSNDDVRAPTRPPAQRGSARESVSTEETPTWVRVDGLMERPTDFASISANMSTSGRTPYVKLSTRPIYGRYFVLARYPSRDSAVQAIAVRAGAAYLQPIAGTLTYALFSPLVPPPGPDKSIAQLRVKPRYFKHHFYEPDATEVIDKLHSHLGVVTLGYYFASNGDLMLRCTSAVDAAIVVQKGTMHIGQRPEREYRAFFDDYTIDWTTRA